MSDEDYSIENLIKTFAKHHEKVLKDRKDLELKIANGDMEFQPWMKETFSISLALHHICKEIKEIKENQRISSGMDFQLPNGIAMKYAKDFIETMDDAKNDR